jgi:surface polysaccharide O-acyltransferase-like enzyme
MAIATGDSARIHFLDNLRALAMLLGVYLHAALAYAEPSRSIWIATNPQGSVLIDASIWWIHLFRMHLFFLLSGYFSQLLLHRRGLGPYLWNRGIRIALPFALFWPLLWAAMAMVFVFALAYIQAPEGLLGAIAQASQDPGAAQSGARYTTMHLWFLYYLLMFSLIGAVASRWNWLQFDWLFQRTWLLALLPLVIVPGVLGGGLPIAAPESFVPTWWPFAYYGFFYWLGWQLFGREELMARLQPWRWQLLLASVILFIPHYRLLPKLELAALEQAAATESLRPSLGEAVLAAYLSVVLTLTVLLLGQRLLARSNAWLKFAADASYWVYLIHLPIVLFLQTLLIPVALPVAAKLCLVIFGTMFFSLATYVLFVRYTPIGWMLNGKRSFP